MTDESALPTFDFIAAKPFRQSLESDYAEMHACHKADAWKSAQVLAGSIVESLLIDYLAATPNSARKNSKDPLKLDLSEAIAICRSESVISERTADLCSVIRSYRNLIHPGRMVRLNEPPPGPKSAAVAITLVDMIAEELANVRRAAVGLTAEQILSKIRRDPSTHTILQHLLQEVSDSERERLVVDLIPNTYLKTWFGEEDMGDYLPRLQKAYPIVFNSISSEARERVAAEFVRVIREDDGYRVEKYGEAFFRPSYLRYVPAQHLPLVRQHLLGRVQKQHNAESLSVVEGIEDFLVPGDVMEWLDPYVRTLISSTANPRLKQNARTQLLTACVNLSQEIDKAIDNRLDEWIRHLQEKWPQDSEAVALLKKEIAEQRIPF